MKYIVSFSGGKDSTAMLLRMLELDMKVDEIIFADTGLEFPELYDYIKKVENYIGRKVKFVNGITWDKWFYDKFTRGKLKGRIRGFPYVVNQCWGTRELKTKPLKKAQGKGNVIYIGITKDEERRTEREEYKKDNKYRFPLVKWGWTEQKCKMYLKKKDMLNPLYEKFDRLGCWLCPKQSKNSLRVLLEDYPDLWEKLKQYEKDSPHGFKPDFSLEQFEKKWTEQQNLEMME